jgi:Xaa-Pro aminopeptidase
MAMFKPETYRGRRDALVKQVKSGVVLLLGNGESPMNYAANAYQFRQDSTFLYYFGLDMPGLAAVIDIEKDETTLFGDDFTVEDIVWMGPQLPFSDIAGKAGISRTCPVGRLNETMQVVVRSNKKVHYIPQYRAENSSTIAGFLGIPLTEVNKNASAELVKAVALQRAVKSREEIKQIEMALDIAYDMYSLAMRLTKPGMYEYEIAGAIEGQRTCRGGDSPFPTILTVHGEVLHGHSHWNRMKSGDLLVIDAGAESPLHYASDSTRTIPVSGRFTALQKDIYSVVLSAQLGAVDMMKTGVSFKDVHLRAAAIIAAGMKTLGFMKGDTAEAVNAGAHALFFPHGLGHLLGLDVHDMENLGENMVGYDATVQRSSQFGLAYLRFAKNLEPGMVLTVEPGIYFMPELIAQWKSQKKFEGFINYSAVEKTPRSFGGVRIEDDVLITKTGSRVLGNPIPKTVKEIEMKMKEK